MTKIAIVQQSASSDRNANIEKGLQAVKEAAANGSKLVCFAELAFDLFYPQEHATDELLKLAEEIPGQTTEAFSTLAKELGIVIVLNLFERKGDDTFDSSPVIDADGSLLGVVRMVHITDYAWFHEKGFYTPGNNDRLVFETAIGKVGVAICYDRHYPEYMRALAVQGAELVIVPQAGAVDEWPEGLYEAELRVASFQNGYFSALCNRVGPESKLKFAGESYVCNPHGEVIARAGKETEEILYCDVNLEEVQSSHAQKLFLKDRRPELYADWLAK